MKQFIDEDMLVKHLKDKEMLISHGGVGSEYLTQLLNINYPHIILPDLNITLKNACVHFPYPPLHLNKVFYIYGDIFNSIISQIRRHPINAAKLCNNFNYKRFNSLTELVNTKEYDPFNIEKQILRFMNDKVSYPIIILKYGFKRSLIPILINVSGNNNFKDYIFKERQSIINLEDDDIKKLVIKYQKTYQITVNSPQLIIRYPTSSYSLLQSDVIKYDVRNNYPGKRIKHFAICNGYEIYNERDINNSYGAIRIKKKGEDIFNPLSLIVNDVEDPRYFIYHDKTYIIMNGTNDNRETRDMYLYNIESNNICKLFINNYDISNLKIQKNWTPYIHLDELYIIYSFNELCILKVLNMTTGECTCIKGNPLNYNNNYKYFGSTPLIQWNYPNYIGFVHTRAPWYSCPIIYNAEEMNVKYIGKPIIFKNPPQAIPWRNKIVQFPYNLEIINNNIILSVEFEDRCPTRIFINYISFCKLFS